jgi:hypothetical protein
MSICQVSKGLSCSGKENITYVCDLASRESPIEIRSTIAVGLRLHIGTVGAHEAFAENPIAQSDQHVPEAKTLRIPTKCLSCQYPA